MANWNKTFKTDKGDFVVMKWDDRTGFYNQIYFNYLNQTVYYTEFYRTKQDRDEMFDSMEIDDCIDTLNTHIANLN